MKEFIPKIPALSRDQIIEMAFRAGATIPLSTPFIFGVRGFTDAERDGNDIGRYDDLISVVCTDKVTTFAANTDPQSEVPGRANLKPGTYQYTLGIHGLSKPKAEQYEALVQAGPVTVQRFGGKEETGYFGINIHRGGEFTSTGSEGCQTLPKRSWDSFLAEVKEATRDFRLKTIPYVLIELHAPADAR